MKTNCIWALSAVLLLSACASPTSILRARQSIPFRAFPTDDGGPAPAIYLWPPYTSAALVDDEGNRCVLTASGAQTVDATLDLALKSDDLLGKVSGLDASSKSKLLEAFQKISSPDTRSTGIDTALFHLCMLDMNGTFKEKHMGPNGKGWAILDAYKFTVQTIMQAPTQAERSAATAASNRQAVDKAGSGQPGSNAEEPKR